MAVPRKKVLFITSGVITLAVFAIILALLLNIQSFKPQIEAAASNALGMDVRIRGRIGITLFPGFGLSMKDTSVRNGETDVVTIEKMRIGLKLIPLMRHEVQIRRVGLIKPAFSIVRDRNGLLNFKKTGRTLWGKTIAVEKISISQGRLVYTNDRSGERIEVDDFDVTIWNLSHSGTDSVEPFKNGSFTGDIRCKTLKINDITITGQLLIEYRFLRHF